MNDFIRKIRELIYTQANSKISSNADFEFTCIYWFHFKRTVSVEAKAPAFSDRKWVNIKSIWTHLRSQNPGALAQPKRYF